MVAYLLAANDEEVGALVSSEQHGVGCISMAMLKRVAARWRWQDCCVQSCRQVLLAIRLGAASA